MSGDEGNGTMAFTQLGIEVSDTTSGGAARQITRRALFEEISPVYFLGLDSD